MMAPPTQAASRPAVEPSLVTIDVDLKTEDGSWQRRPVESLLIDRRTGRPPPRMVWAFTGSFFHRDRKTGVEFFVADMERSVIAMWYDPTAMLNITQDVGNPYRGNASGLAVDPAKVPKRGSQVRLILHRTSPRTGSAE